MHFVSVCLFVCSSSGQAADAEEAAHSDSRRCEKQPQVAATHPRKGSLECGVESNENVLQRQSGEWLIVESKERRK